MIGLVLVSHSARLAEGLTELLAQFTQNRVPLRPVGGTADGELGTDALRIQAAIEELLDGPAEEGVLVFVDLGSAVLSTRTALEFLGEEAAGKVRLSGAPFVEGATAAAVEAMTGAGLDEAAQAAEGARSIDKF